MRPLALASLIVLAACQPARIPPTNVAIIQPPLSVTAAARSTFKVEATVVVDTGTGESETVYWSGTAWIYEANAGFPVKLVTAGHVCAGPTLDDLNPGHSYPVQSATYSLVSQTGAVTTATMTRRSDDPDLCLLAAAGYLGAPLPVSSADPYYDQPVAYVGAPAGIFGDGMAPLYNGFYAGGDLVAIPTAGGASGSAVFTNDGVIGVLVAVSRDFPDETFIESRRHLLDFLSK